MICGIGVDVIEIERVMKVVEKHSEKVIKRIFTQAELDYSYRFSNPFTHLAARFSAKEAFYKAMGFGVIRFAQIEVYNTENGKPEIRLHGETREQWKEIGSPKIHLSLSHNNLVAVATVVLENTD
jgi:holo-[acyl-carrier protein] synthase